MRFLKIAFIALLAIPLGGCPGRTVITDPIIVDTAPINIPQVEPLKLDGVNWVVITSLNKDTKIEDLLKSGISVVYALTPEDFEKLGLNDAEYRRFIQQQQIKIEALQQYYEKQQENKKEK